MHRGLNIFLCYSSHDYLLAKALYKRLSAYLWMRPWLEFGTDWKKSLESAINGAHVVIILISKQSISKYGYSQEIFERTIELIKENRKKFFCVIALRLDECILPTNLQHLEWQDYFGKNAHEKLINFLSKFSSGSITTIYTTEDNPNISPLDEFPIQNSADIYENLDWHRYIKINSTSNINYPFLIGKYHVTNEQYLTFLKSKDYADDFYWTNFPKYNETCTYIGNWGDAGLTWLKKQLKWLKEQPKSYPSLLEGRLDWIWRQPSSATARHINYDYRQPNHYAQVTWFEANAYCKWFARHWRELPEAKNLSSLLSLNSNFYVRLPLETEFYVAVKYDDLTRIQIDPTLRLHAKRHPGLALDISATDMLANCYGKNRPDDLVYCDGYLYIDEYTRDLARVGFKGSLNPSGELDYGFRLAILESHDA